MKVFLEKIKKYKLSKRPICHQAGMTYVELIVVLSIFSIFSGIAIFNYKDFQVKVDIKNLANDIALQIVEAQKSALNGKLPPPSQQSLDPEWKPSYGIYFDTDLPTSFVYFVDTFANKEFDTSSIPCNNECLDVINIIKGNSIAGIQYFDSTGDHGVSGDFSITFTRPDSGATFVLNHSILSDIDRVEIWVSSPGLATYSIITIYPSGRVEIN
ncbi:MAG: type II secretion system protein [Candidatus Pacebacteria bacterium]|nr:type II secretion system protein [Candidatus Paceibacterota bacterium]